MYTVGVRNSCGQAPEEPGALYLDDDAQDIVPAQVIGPRVGQGELPSCHRVPECSQVEEERVQPYTGEGTESARSTALLIVHDGGMWDQIPPL
jgi:hypothetical protein